MSNESPASILFNELGNPVGVLFDGYVFRLQVQGILDDPEGHGPVSVKAPNTPAVASDSALVVAISPNNSFTVTEQRPSTIHTSSVAVSTSNVTLLASNVARLGATIFNDSTAVLYIKLGVTASTTDFAIKLFPQCYYEIPFGWTGEIDGFWNASVSGAARIGEMTP